MIQRALVVVGVYCLAAAALLPPGSSDEGSLPGPELPERKATQSALPRAAVVSWSEKDILVWDDTDKSSPRIQLNLDGCTEPLELESISLLTSDAQISINGDPWPDAEIAGGIRCYRGMTGDNLVLAVVMFDCVAGVVFPTPRSDPAPATPSDDTAATIAPSLIPPGGDNAAIDESFPFVRLALDADVEFFVRFGGRSYARTVQEMLLAVNALDFLFQREVGIRYRVSYVNVWMSEPDPYWSVNTKDLANGMREWWNAHRAWVIRDSAHLFSGKVMDKPGGTPQRDGGFPGYICDVGWAYSVSSAGSGGDPLLNLYNNIMHEQGHQWGSGHCSGADCRLMCGDASCFKPIFEFEPFTRQLIRDKLEQSWCVGLLDEEASGADLIVAGLILPDFSLGHSGHVGIQVKNVGTSRALTIAKLWTWLTLDGDPFGGLDDIPMGGPGLCERWPGVPVDLMPGKSQTYWFDTFPVPLGAHVGDQTFVAWVDAGAPPCGSLCESNENNNLGSAPARIIADGAALTWLDTPGKARSGDPVSVRFRATNHSAGPLDLPVNVCIGGNCAPTVWLYGVAPGEEREGVASVFAPDSPFNCGSSESFQATACVNLLHDDDRSNDCRSQPIAITGRWWDVRFEISSAPPSVVRGNWITFKVKISNPGNVPSDDVCAITGITLYPGARRWDAHLGILKFSTGQISAGGSKERTFQYFVPGWASCPKTQYIKAEIDYVAGCHEFCGTDDFGQRGIGINCHP